MQKTHQPKVLTVQPGNEPDAARLAAEALRRGSLVILPTDTVYGVAADPRVPGAEQRLYAAKRRDAAKPVPLLAADLGQIEAYGGLLDEVERRLAGRFWPGPLTLVIRTGHGFEGFRIPNHGLALAVIGEGGGVLRVTSANISGCTPALCAAEAAAALSGHVALVVDAGPSMGGVPSTVAQVTSEGIRILREGAIGRDELLRALSA